MANINIAAFLSCNVDGKSISSSALSSLSIHLASLFDTQVEHVTLDLQINPMMMRGGFSSPMLNIRLFHNSNKVDSDSKHDLAKDIASWAARNIRIPEDRVLVLFLDTRCCSAI